MIISPSLFSPPTQVVFFSLAKKQDTKTKARLDHEQALALLTLMESHEAHFFSREEIGGR